MRSAVRRSCTLFSKLHTGADVCSDGLGGLQSIAALSVGEFLHFRLLGHGIDGLAADRAPGLLTLGLVADYVVAAIGAFPSRQLVCAHVDGVATSAINLLARKKSVFDSAFLSQLGHSMTNLAIFPVLLFLCFFDGAVIQRGLIIEMFDQCLSMLHYDF